MVAKYLSVHDHIHHHQYSSHTRIEMFTFIPQSKLVRTTAIVGKIEIIRILCLNVVRFKRGKKNLSAGTGCAGV